MHSWKFYTNTAEAWEAMLEALENAKHSIDLEQYIFYLDGIGLKFIDVLKRRALDGISIRVICDGVGSYSIYRSNIPEELRDLGIKFRIFNPLLPWSPNNESWWYFRDHQKLLIIDGVIGFTGGICLGEEMKGWRESHVKIIGPAVEEMSKSFELMWQKQYRKPRYLINRAKKEFLMRPEKEFSYVTNYPIPGKRFMYYELLRAIRKAKRYIYITTPYFLPDRKLLKSIKKAVRRRVDVKLLIPFSPNHTLADIGAKTFFTEVLEANVKIFRYRSMIHSKTVVIDDSWSTIGSLNLDNLSLKYNFEANLVSLNKEFALELKSQFMKDLSYTGELTLREWDKRGLKEKILEFLIFPFRKLI